MGEIKCAECGRTPDEILEYSLEARAEGMTPDELAMEDGTYNSKTKKFFCTECYIKLGMPLGKVPDNYKRRSRK